MSRLAPRHVHFHSPPLRSPTLPHLPTAGVRPFLSADHPKTKARDSRGDGNGFEAEVVSSYLSLPQPPLWPRLRPQTDCHRIGHGLVLRDVDVPRKPLAPIYAENVVVLESPI